MALLVVNTFLHYEAAKVGIRRVASDPCITSVADIPKSVHRRAAKLLSKRTIDRRTFDSDNSTASTAVSGHSLRSWCTSCDSDVEDTNLCGSSARSSDGSVENIAVEEPASRTVISLAEACRITADASSAGQIPLEQFELLQRECVRLQRENSNLQQVVAAAAAGDPPARDSCSARTPMPAPSPPSTQARGRVRKSRPSNAQCNGCQTTVMVRNIPNCLTRAMFMQLLTDTDFLQLCDFLYLPIDEKTGVNRGYAFVNLANEVTALRFFQKFEAFNTWSAGSLSLPSSKVCSVNWCVRQGQRANVQYWRKCVTIAKVPETFRPMMSVNGVLQSFTASR